MKPYKNARRRLLEATGRLLSRDGVHAVSLVAIAKEARVARATLYKCFASKDEFVTAYLDEAFCRERSRVRDVAAGVTTPDQARAAILNVTKLPGDDEHVSVFVVALTGYPDRDHPARVAVGNWSAWFATVITDLLTAGGYDDPRHQANDIHCLWWGAVARHHLEDSDQTRIALERQIVGLLRDGPA